jgi:hypothetical protein
MFVCDKCGLESSNYDSKAHTFKCDETKGGCGHIGEIKPKTAYCFSCGKPYTQYTWFDPSGCPYCHRSFVD